MVQKQGKFPSIWIQCQFEPDENGDIKKVWDVSVKMKAFMKANHINMSSKEEAIKYCLDTYGRYDSIRENY